MNDREIIRMARKAGFREPNPHDGYMGLAFNYRKGNDTGASLERLVELVRADEREKVAAWMMQRGYATGHGDAIEDLLQELEWQVRESEREACAKLCDELFADVPPYSAPDCAAAIRARGTHEV